MKKQIKPFEETRIEWFSKMDLRARIGFLKMIKGHEFQILAIKTLPRGKSVSCARCGYKLRHYLELKRDDGQILKISKDCLRKANLKAIPCSTLTRAEKR